MIPNRPCLPSGIASCDSARYPDQTHTLGENTMSTLNIVFIAWVILTAAFGALMVYRGHHTQHETDQLFLSESTSHNVVEEHDDILRRVNLIEPLCKGFGGAAALVTLLLIGVYVSDAIARL